MTRDGLIVALRMTPAMDIAKADISIRAPTTRALPRKYAE